LLVELNAGMCLLEEGARLRNDPAQPGDAREALIAGDHGAVVGDGQRRQMQVIEGIAAGTVLPTQAEEGLPTGGRLW